MIYFDLCFVFLQTEKVGGLKLTSHISLLNFSTLFYLYRNSHLACRARSFSLSCNPVKASSGEIINDLLDTGTASNFAFA